MGYNLGSAYFSNFYEIRDKKITKKLDTLLKKSMYICVSTGICSDRFIHYKNGGN